jgi:hypothetical protein
MLYVYTSNLFRHALRANKTNRPIMSIYTSTLAVVEPSFILVHLRIPIDLNFRLILKRRNKRLEV